MASASTVCAVTPWRGGGHGGGGLDQLDPVGRVLFVGVAGAGWVVVGPEQEADAVAADSQGMEDGIAAGLGAKAGAGRRAGRGQEGDEAGADRVPTGP